MSEAMDSALGEGVSLRRATPADLATVLEVVQDAARWVQVEKRVPQWRLYLSDAGIADVKRYFAGAGGEEVYLARRAGRPVGALAVTWSDPQVWDELGADGLAGYLHMLNVHRAARGTRLGERMMAWAERLIAARGRALARLDCRAGSAFLPHYYPRLGYTAVACRNGPRGLVLFEKRVAPAAPQR
jgi:ribosomal protein S18 acetylase RimI-like enzyme